MRRTEHEVVVGLDHGGLRDLHRLMQQHLPWNTASTRNTQDDIQYIQEMVEEMVEALLTAVRLPRTQCCCILQTC